MVLKQEETAGFKVCGGSLIGGSLVVLWATRATPGNAQVAKLCWKFMKDPEHAGLILLCSKYQPLCTKWNGGGGACAQDVRKWSEKEELPGTRQGGSEIGCLLLTGLPHVLVGLHRGGKRG